MYKVLKDFTDEQDKGRAYFAGLPFPADGAPQPSEERIAELLCSDNARGEPLIVLEAAKPAAESAGKLAVEMTLDTTAAASLLEQAKEETAKAAADREAAEQAAAQAAADRERAAELAAQAALDKAEAEKLQAAVPETKNKASGKPAAKPGA